MNVNSKDAVLYLVITLVTIALALLMIRWLAPTLLGIPEDRLLVRTARSVPPYFEIVFSRDDLLSGEFLLPDPIVKSRGRPFYPNSGSIGPHDVLGFRNESVPQEAEVVIIGDSQTYGNNALIWENWPHVLGEGLADQARVYTMATGGWGPVQYFYALMKSIIFLPKVIVVAIYTGNDPLDAYSMAFATVLGNEFLPETDLGPGDLPVIEYPSGTSDQWLVKFSDGSRTVFTPRYRDASSRPHPAVDLGHEIMINIVRRMAEITHRQGIQLVTTLIPTKEYVFHERVAGGNQQPPAEYSQLVENEGQRIDTFVRAMQNIDNVHYVDVVQPLMDAASSTRELYPDNENGHPLAAGYSVIANAVYESITPLLATPENGRYVLVMPDNIQKIIEVENGRFYIVNDPLFTDPVSELPVLQGDAIRRLKFAGHRSDKVHAVP